MVRRTQGGASGRILEAATQLFSERGYRDTSIEDIASAADISRSSLFWHFESKDGLLHAVVEDFSRSWEKVILAVGNQYRGLAAAETTIRAHAQHFETQPTMARLAVVLWGEAHSAESELAQIFNELSNDLSNALAAWLAQAIEGGEIRSDVDPRGVAVVVVAAIQAMGKLWAMNSNYDITRAHKAILDLFGYLRPTGDETRLAAVPSLIAATSSAPLGASTTGSER